MDEFEQWWENANTRLTDLPKAQAKFIWDEARNKQAEPVVWRDEDLEGIARKLLADEYDMYCGGASYEAYAKLARAGVGEFTLRSIRAIVKALKYTHPAPAVAVNKDLAKAIHYPQCWDVAAYPTLAHAISELATCFQCCECVKNPAVAVNEQALRGWNSRHVNETPKIEHDSDDVLMKTGDVNHVGDANKMVRLTDKQIMGIDAITPGGLIQFANAIMDAMIKKNGE